MVELWKSNTLLRKSNKIGRPRRRISRRHNWAAVAMGCNRTVATTATQLCAIRTEGTPYCRCAVCDNLEGRISICLGRHVEGKERQEG